MQATNNDNSCFKEYTTCVSRVKNLSFNQLIKQFEQCDERLSVCSKTFHRNKKLELQEQKRRKIPNRD